MKYRFQLDTTAGDLPWSYDFDMHSDTMAIDYCKRIARYDSFAQIALGLVLFNIETDRVLAHFVPESRTVRNLIGA
jgi:hypothetical protein